MAGTSPTHTATVNGAAAHDVDKTTSDVQSHHSANNYKHHSGANAATVEYGYPHGHLGHLTAEEDKSFQDFKKFLLKEGLYKPGPPPSHDDATLL